MKRLLFIESSPRGRDSVTSGLARKIVCDLLDRNRAWQVDHLDLWRQELPAMAGATVAAKYKVFAGEALGPEEERAWRLVAETIEGFRAADLILLAVPMWNFGIPYVLKHYIDVVTQPRLTFTWTPEQGYRSLLPPRRAIVVTSSAGDYGRGSGNEAQDYQLPYLRDWLRIYMGCRVECVAVSPTIAEPEAVEAASLAAARRAAELAMSA